MKKVLNLERKGENVSHIADEWVISGMAGSESKNKDLDEKIENISEIFIRSAGTLKTMPEVKIEEKDIRKMFNEGRVPPEIMDYISLSFDKVLEYKEDRGFDWDCFLCAMIGVAQIVAGVALEVLSCGAAHLVA